MTSAAPHPLRCGVRRPFRADLRWLPALLPADHNSSLAADRSISPPSFLSLPPSLSPLPRSSRWAPSPVGRADCLLIWQKPPCQPACLPTSSPGIVENALNPRERGEYLLETHRAVSKCRGAEADAGLQGPHGIPWMTFPRTYHEKGVFYHGNLGKPHGHVQHHGMRLRVPFPVTMPWDSHGGSNTPWRHPYAQRAA